MAPDWTAISIQQRLAAGTALAMSCAETMLSLPTTRRNKMKLFRRLVVAALLAVWFFPSASFANSEPVTPPVASTPMAQMAQMAPTAATSPPSASAEVASLAAREKQAQNLTDFKGGAVYVYLGSGVVLVLVIILLILLV
jgi:hypothetical protein